MTSLGRPGVRAHEGRVLLTLAAACLLLIAVAVLSMPGQTSLRSPSLSKLASVSSPPPQLVAKATIARAGDDVVGRGIVAGGGSLYYTNDWKPNSPADDGEALVGQFALPITNGAAPVWQKDWPSNGVLPDSGPFSCNTGGYPSYDNLSAVDLGPDGVFFSGSSYTYTTDAVGCKEAKEIAVKYPFNGAGAGLAGDTWPVGQTTIRFYPGSNSYDGGESFSAGRVSVEGGATYFYGAGSAQSNGCNSTQAIRKYDANGNPVWQWQQAAGCGSSGFNAVAVSGTTVYAGGYSSYDGNIAEVVLFPTAGTSPTATFKSSLDAGFSSEAYTSLTVSNSTIYAAGYEATSGEQQSYLLDAWSVSGTQLFHRVWSSDPTKTNGQQLTGVITIGGRLFAVGWTRDTDSPATAHNMGSNTTPLFPNVAAYHGFADGVIFETDPVDGHLLSTTSYGLNDSVDEALTAVTSDGIDLYVLGAERDATNFYHGLLLRYGFAAAVLSTSSIAFGNQRKGTTSTGQSVSISNTGTGTLNISGYSLTGANAGDFSVTPASAATTVAPNGTPASWTVFFTPSTTNSESATLTFSTDAGDRVVALSGTGIFPQTVISTNAIGFGNQRKGTTSAGQTVSISNPGTDTLNISGYTLSGPNLGDFSVTPVSAATTVAPGGTPASWSVKFTPSTTGAEGATLTFSTDNGPQAVSLSGTGIFPHATISATSLTFGLTAQGATTAGQSVSIGNSGTDVLNVGSYSLSGPNAADFHVSPAPASSQVAIGAAETWSVSFSPTATGAESANLTFPTDNGPMVVALSGTVAMPGSWHGLPGMPAAMTQASGVVVNGNFYVIGGDDGAGGASNQVLRYDPNAGLWTVAATLPHGGRYFGAAAAVGTKIYVIGGWQKVPALPTNTVDIYDTSTGAWSVGTPTAQLTGCGAADAIGTTIYLYSVCNGFSGYVRDFLAYDTVANTWTTLAGPPHAHVYPGGAAVAGAFYLADGWNDNAVSRTADLDAYTPGSGWATLASAPTARANVVATAVAGHLYVVGGYNSTGTKVATVEGFDPGVGRWGTNIPLSSPLAGPAVGSVNGLLYVAGGNDAVNSSVNALAPASAPAAPTGVNASWGNATAVVNWGYPPTDGGSPITSFTVTASPGGASIQTNCCNATFSGLSNGTTYTFTVTATNSVGTSPPSAPSNAVTPSSLYFGSGSNIGFGNVPDGVVSDPFSLNTFNASPTAAHIGQVTITGPNAGDFHITSGNCANSTLTNSGFCFETITFAPTQLGGESATLTMQSDAPGAPQLVQLQGNGTGPAPYLSLQGLTFSGLNFDQVPVGSSQTKSLTVSNRGQQNLSIGATTLAGPNSADYAITSDGCANVTLIAGQGTSCGISVKFAPLARGDRRANLSIPSNSDSNPTFVGMIGTGIVPPDAPGNVYVGTGANGTNLIWQNRGDGGSPITGATITVQPGGAVYHAGGCCGYGFGDFDPNHPLFQVGTTYTFSVALTNAAGTGPSAQSNPMTPTTVPFGGPSPPFQFGHVPVGVTSDPITVRMAQFNGQPVQFGQAAVSGANASDFHIVADSCSNRLVQFMNNDCALTLDFAPTAAGDEVASLDVPTNGTPSPTSGILVGTGVTGPAGYLSLSGLDNPCCPPGIGFNNTPVGTAPSRTVTLTDRGNAPIHLGNPAAMVDPSQPVTVSGNCSGATLSPNAACQLIVTYAPTARGQLNEVINLNHDAVNQFDLLGHVLGVNGNAIVPPSAPKFVLAAVTGSKTGGTSAQVAWDPNIDDGGVQCGKCGDLTITITASNGGGSQTTGPGGQPDAFFSGLTIGTTYTFTVVVTNAAGSSAAVVSNPITASNIFLQGNNFFGQVPVGYSSQEGLINLQTGGGGPIHTGAISLSGPNPNDFAVTFAGCANATIYSNGSQCQIGVVFAPHVANPACAPSCGNDVQRFALLRLPDDASGSPRTAILQGSVFITGSNDSGAAPVLFVTPSQLPLGAAVGHSSAPALATITNNGNAAADFTAQPLQLKNNSGAFSLAGSCLNSLLAVGASCTVSITFTPQVGGGDNAFLDTMGFGASLNVNGFGYTPPPAPTNIVVAPGNGLLNVGWNFQGGGGPNTATISAYRFTAYQGGVAVASTTIPQDGDRQIVGLSNGATYTVTVAAINPAGMSPESAMSAPATPGPAQLAPLRSYAPAFTANGTWFSDPLHGWEVGNPGVIMATTDGGATWHAQVSGTTYDLNAVTFVDSMHGWVVGQQQGGASAIVLRTIDGGAHWSAITPPDATGLFGVAFTSATHGWVTGYHFVLGAGARPVILGTEDGGLTWTVQLDSYSNGGVGPISAVDAAHAWVTGWGGQIYMTSDGSHWSRQAAGTNALLNSVSFVDSLHGWTGGGKGPGPFQDGVMLVTSDGGNTWSPQTLPSLGYCSTVPSIAGVQFLSQTTGWAVATALCVPGSAGNVIMTVDGGLTWTIREPVLQGRFHSLHFTDANHGWLGGEFGVIEATADGGGSWTLQNNAGNFLAIAFSDSVHGVATGLFGEVYTTADSGQSWTFRPTPIAGQLTGVGYLDASHVVAVDNGGSVLNSSDGGATWTEQLTPVANQQGLKAVGIVDPMHAWAVGTGGTILKLNGNSWVSVASPTTADLNAIVVVDAQHAWAAGGSTIVATTDGVSWTARANIPGASINGLAFTDALHGYAVGAGGGIYATADGGATWVAESSGTAANLLEVGFSDGQHGWAGGTLGALLETIDGGAHWTSRPSGSDDYVLRAIRPFDPGHVLFAASGARIYLWSETPTASPASVSYLTQPLGTTSSARQIDLTASGTGDLRIASATLGGANPGDFRFFGDGCTGATVHVGSSCSVTVTFSPTAPGARSATLSFSDDGTGTPQQVQLTGTGGLVPTSTSLASATNPSVFGQPVTFTATVTGNLPGYGTPTGTVSFFDGGTLLGTGSLTAGGVATFATNSLAVGSHQIVASYGGDATFAASSPSAGTWSVTASLAAARYWQTATLLPSGKVLVAGGGGDWEWPPTAVSELYDATAGTWATTGAMNVARGFSPTATLLANGKVLVAGGNSTAGLQASAELYDPATGAWATTGTMGSARQRQTATLLPNGKVLVAGGQGTTGPLASAELYDPASGTWTPTGTMLTARFWANATLLPSGKVLVAGGVIPASSTTPTSAAELYDPATGTWTATGSMNAAREEFTMTLLSSGKVLAAGGCCFSNSAELYDPTTGSWTLTGSMTMGRGEHAATLLPNGKVLVTAGLVLGAVTWTAELYDPASGTWTATASLSLARAGHTATLLNNGSVLLSGGLRSFLASGGDGCCTFTGESEIYDGGSVAGRVTQVVNQAATSTTLGSSVNPSVAGQPVTLTATVAAVAPGAGAPTGAVVFQDGSTTLGSASLVTSGGVTSATFTTSSFNVGSHALSASYGGDPSFTSSTGSATQVVNKAATAVSLGSSTNPTVFGQPTTLTATVAVVSPGSTAFANPTGPVTFSDGGTVLGTGTLATSGGVTTASFTTAALAVANHSLTAAYGGDGSFLASTSAQLSQVVNQASTSTSLASSANPSLFGQSVTFTATVSPVAPGAGVPSGTVTFSDGTVVIGTATLTGGTGSVATASLLGGSHSITVSYAGDSSFKPSSTPSALVESITFTSTITTKVSTLTVDSGQAVSITSTGSVTGNIVVNAGGALSVDGGQVFGKLTSTGATAVALCGGTFKNTVAINGTSGLVLVGGNLDGPIPSYCGANSIPALSLDGNKGQVEIDGNSVSGNVSLTNTAAVMAPEIEGNLISGNLNCSTNSPAPVNGGFANTVKSKESGQCLGL